jgi:hypothetical protein
MQQEYDYRTQLLETIRRRIKLIQSNPRLWEAFKMLSFKKTKFALQARSIAERDKMLEEAIEKDAFKGIVQFEAFIMGDRGLMRPEDHLRWFYFRLQKYENFVKERGRKK